MLFEVDEKVVLGPLLRESVEFERFYKEEREKKIGLIWWFRDFDMLEGIEAYVIVFESAIYYRKSPTSPEDAHTMAHEIMHLVRYQESKFLEIKYTQLQHEYLAAKLASMLEDPIIDSFLQKNYNFDLRIPYRYAIDYCRKNIKTEATDDLSRLINGIDLANYMISWKLIDIDDMDAQNEWSNYLRWYEKLRPYSYEIANQIVRILWVHGGAHGAETIDKQKRVVTAMINLYPQLRNMISI
ncbi:Uncharacterised protein [uncultured archaeon]|nr:Uncharacterised protein [uncultured archaeon]